MIADVNLHKAISIHALREEGDSVVDDVINFNIKFLSTPSARRATKTDLKYEDLMYNFYPRPPRGGRPLLSAGLAVRWYFYPRPPRGGRRARAS